MFIMQIYDINQIQIQTKIKYYRNFHFFLNFEEHIVLCRHLYCRLTRTKCFCKSYSGSFLSAIKVSQTLFYTFQNTRGYCSNSEVQMNDSENMAAAALERRETNKEKRGRLHNQV